MADYKQLLRRAVDALPENNGAARRQVYEKARTALVTQLRAIEPPLPAREITQHRLQLEDCIRDVEQEATEQLLSGFKALETEPAPETAPTPEPAPEPAPSADETPAPSFEHTTDTEHYSETSAQADAPTPELADDNATEVTVEDALSSAQSVPTTDMAPADVSAETETSEVPIEEAFSDRPTVFSTPAADTEYDDVAPPSDGDEVYAEAGSDTDITPERGDDVFVMGSVIADDPEVGEDGQETAADLRADTPDPIPPTEDGQELPEPDLMPEPSHDDGPVLVHPDDSGQPGSPDQIGGFSPDLTASQGDSAVDAEDDENARIEALINAAAAEDAPSEDAGKVRLFESDSSESEVAPPVTTYDAPEMPEVQSDAATPDPHTRAEPVDTFFPAQPQAPQEPKSEPVDEVDESTDSETDAPAMSEEREVEVEPAPAFAGPDADAQDAIDRAIATLDREARGETTELPATDGEDAGVATTTSEDIDEPVQESTEDAEGGGAITIFLIVLALLLAGAGGVGYWAWQEGYIDLDSVLGQSDTTQQVADTPADDSAGLDEPVGPGNTTSTPDVTAPVSPEMGKIEDRLPASGPNSEGTPTTQTPVADTPGSTDDKIEDRLTGTAETSFDDGADDATTADGQSADTQGDGADDPVDAVAEAGAQSLLLEASAEGTTGAVPFSGSVEWARGTDELGQPTIEATANIPARNLGVQLLLRRNADPSLPASHLMEIDFTVTDSFIGGAVASLPGVLLKNEELVRGTPLVGASARVVGNSFLFALSAEPSDLETNRNLLLSQKWMDLALIYATSIRAIITLEKDDAAQAMFEEVLAVWAEADAEANGDAPETPAASEGVNVETPQIDGGSDG